MSAKDEVLAMSSNLNFTSATKYNREKLLNEALEIVACADNPMGANNTSLVQSDERKQLALDLLNKLKREQALFSPKLGIHPLTKKAFEERGIVINHEISSRFRENNFYYIAIPITLFPQSGWAFTRLECVIEFCSGEQNTNLITTAYEIMPDDVWAEILSFQDEIALGIDENLQFTAQVDRSHIQLSSLSAEAKVRVGLDTSAIAKLAIGPFHYCLRRSKIRARGRGNSALFWRLDGQKYIDEEDITLGIILMVPKSRSTPIPVIGALKAYHHFQLLSAELKDWFNDFPATLRSLILGGVPVEHTLEWVINC
ncbi:MAG: hypothetical protein AB1489_27200 [Acidobacteriota bacterium]